MTRRHYWLMLGCVLGVAALIAVAYRLERARAQHIARELRAFHQARRGVAHTQSFEANDAVPGIPLLIEDLRPSEVLVDSNRVVVSSQLRLWRLSYSREYTLMRQGDGKSWRLFSKDSIRPQSRSIITITDR